MADKIIKKNFELPEWVCDELSSMSSQQYNKFKPFVELLLSNMAHKNKMSRINASGVVKYANEFGAMSKEPNSTVQYGLRIVTKKGEEKEFISESRGVAILDAEKYLSTLTI